MRREPRVGIGDSAHTVEPTRAPVSVAQTAAAVPVEGGDPAGAGAATASAPSQAAPSTAPLADKETAALQARQQYLATLATQRSCANHQATSRAG